MLDGIPPTPDPPAPPIRPLLSASARCSLLVLRSDLGSMRASNKTFTSDDGALLFAYRWEPDSPPRALVHIAHGLAEHAHRYERLALALARSGYLVCANDHRGHGRTAFSRDDLGFFAADGGWNRVVEDLCWLIRLEKNEFPGIPAVVLGHSMGSFMARHLLAAHPGLVDGCVLSGSGHGRRILSLFLRSFARIERKRLRKRGRSGALQEFMLNSANRPFRPTRTDFDWLSRDAIEVSRYVADPLCGFTCTTQLMLDILEGFAFVEDLEARSTIPADMPIYFVAGTKDPLSKGGRHLKKLMAKYKARGLQRVSHRFYTGGRHEMFNEINRDEVTADLITWLDGITGTATE